MNDEQLDRWRLDKRVSVADILSVAVSAVMVILAYATLDKRITVLEAQALQRTEDLREIKGNVEYIRRVLEEMQRRTGATPQ